MSTNRIEEYLKKRIDEISELIHEVATGNFDYKLELNDMEDELEGLIGGINMLGEELKASTVSKDFMESIYQGVADILIIFNKDLKIERVNAATTSYLGYEPHDLINRDLSYILSEESLLEIETILAISNNKETLRNTELRLKRKDQLSLETSCSFSPLFDNQKNHLGSILIAKDITNIKNTERELLHAREKAIVANKTKTSFLANMSHEIRTPLNGMLGFVELLSTTELSETQSNYLNLVKSSGQSLSKLLNDILDLTKVESGKLNIERITFDLHECVRSCFMTHTYIAKKKNLEINLYTEAGTPRYIIGDPSRITQIITNLLGNSLKFTEEGYVNLEVSVKKSDKNQSTLNISVSDTGIGIPKDVQDNIFETFTQIDSSTTRKFGGSGLGLTITKHLAELMGGTIGVKSPLTNDGSKIGTAFYVQIPIEETKQEIVANPQRKKEEFPKLPDGFTVLIVDDNEINLLLAQKILEKLNAQVETAHDGFEGVRKAFKKNYDMILMDIQMPRMDGFEATVKLRKGGYSRTIIALSANVYEEDIKQCYDSGMDGHIGKPFSTSQIYNKIVNTIGKIAE